MTLDEEIKQLVSLGESDPLDIARKIIARNDKHWLESQLVGHAEDVISDFARRELGSIRRKAELALRPGDQLAAGDLRIAKAWVPGEGWKQAAQLTRPDLLRRAEWYERFADASLRRALWCRDVASMMDAEGAETLGDLRADLPALPLEAVIELTA